MSEADLRRLRADLETMREAAGPTLPFDWSDVWLTLGLIPTGAFLAAWAAVSVERYAIAGLIPALLLALGGSALWAKRWRNTGRSALFRREYVFGWVSSTLFGLALMGYIFWGKRFGLFGLSIAELEGVALFSWGLLCAVLALSSPGRRRYFAGALMLVPCGLVFPFCSSQQKLVVGGLALMVAGLTGALIEAWQLRAAGRGHERATH